MNYCEPINIKHKNSINDLGNTLIKMRNAIVSSNVNVKLSSIQQLKLIFLSCIYIQQYDEELSVASEDIKKICNFFRKKSALGNDWIHDYLQIKSTDLELIDVSSAVKIFKKFYDADTFSFLVPYALEILEYSDDELESALKDRRNGIITSKKKNKGIYYTPSDVVTYMVNLCMKNLQKKFSTTDLLKLKYADLSCGSGVFLRQILRDLAGMVKFLDVNEYIKIIKNTIFGIDISEYAVESTRFLIMLEIADRFKGAIIDYAKLLKILRINIICADAIDKKTINNRYPNYPDKFHCIIGNPPYVEIKKIFASKSLKDTSNKNLFIDFVHCMIDASEEKSYSALVVPLSLSYNTNISYCDLRSRIQSDNAKWVFENYDRSPDSLFGDDVKSRNCIVIRNTLDNENGIFSTGLLRWTSVNRKEFLFSDRMFGNIGKISIKRNIPKLSTTTEIDSYIRLTTQNKFLMEMLVSATETTDKKIVLRSTAYNWICAYDHIPNVTDKLGANYISKGQKYYTTRSDGDLYFVLACLNSICAYWLWTVSGDGFHVTQNLLKIYGVHKDYFSIESYQKMVWLGEEVSKKLKLYPTKSINSGKLITNYNYSKVINLSHQIDDIICHELGLAKEFPAMLEKWYYSMIECGR